MLSLRSGSPNTKISVFLFTTTNYPIRYKKDQPYHYYISCVTFKYQIFLCTVFISSSFARPQDAPIAPISAESSLAPIPIVSQSENIGVDGNFNFSYDTGNGIHYEQTGYTKQNPNAASADGVDAIIQVMSGSFSYPAPDGTQINLSYVADENGYQPVGEHLPTPPPIPESIQKILATLPQVQDTAQTDSQAAPSTL